MANRRSQRKFVAMLAGVVVYLLSFYYFLFVDMSSQRAWAQTVGNTNSTVYLPVVSRQEPPTPTPVSHVNTGAHAIADPFDLQWHMGGNNSKEQTNHDDCLAGFNAIVKLHA